MTSGHYCDGCAQAYYKCICDINVNKCGICGYDYKGSGDTAHVCGYNPIKLLNDKVVPRANDRIRQLAEQALKSSMVHDGVYRPEGYNNAVSKEFADKFAELIVREYSYDVMNLTAAPEHVVMAARHWGVEL